MRNEKSPTYILGFWTLISSNRWYFSIKKKIFCPFESIFFFFCPQGGAGQTPGTGPPGPGVTDGVWSTSTSPLRTPLRCPSEGELNHFPFRQILQIRKVFKIKMKKIQSAKCICQIILPICRDDIYFFGITYVPTFLRTLCRY